MEKRWMVSRKIPACQVFVIALGKGVAERGPTERGPTERGPDHYLRAMPRL
jgi:hypothetical protein